jgi:hypothetical protein
MIELTDTLKYFTSKEFRDYFENVKNNIVPSFINRDWYLSSVFLDLANLETLYYEEQTANLDNKIIRAFATYLIECKKQLLKKFPERKKIILEIFFCYENRKYSSVITLAYSTAEGVVSSNFGQGLWGGFDKKTQKNLFEKLRDNNQLTGVMNLFYKRFSHRGEINRDSKEFKVVDTSSNNRHLVLHGHSYNYGNKKNAVKAILLLDFINELVFWEKVWKKQNNI